jgi:altronate dehydratase
MTDHARGWQALAVHPDDDVAVALADLPADALVDVRRGGAVERRHVAEAVPLGHKFALRAIARGSPVRKYGECIGVAARDIAAGAHVHVHNLSSRRGGVQR